MSTRSILCEKLKGKNAGTHIPRPAFCAGLRCPTCTWDMAQEAFLRGNCSGNLPDATDTTSIEHRALNTYRKKPLSVWPHCFGEKSPLGTPKTFHRSKVYTEKCRAPVRHAHEHVSRGMLGGNLQGKCRTRIHGVFPGATILCYMDMSQEACWAEI